MIIIFSVLSFLLSFSFTIGFLVNSRRWKSPVFPVTVQFCSNNNQPVLSYPYNGLLEGISNISTAKYYSSSISLQPVADIVKNKRLLYKIVEADCDYDSEEINKYLQRIFENTQVFMNNNTVWDRKDLYSGLDQITEVKGNFACLLGGKSTGKTLVLNEFSTHEKGNRKVIYVNLRNGYSSITDGFVEVINKSKNEVWKEILWAFLKKGLQSKVKVSDEVELDFSSFIDVVRTDKEPIKILKSLLIDMTLRFPHEVITLVVDEANLALTINEDSSKEDIKQVKASLALFTSLTKEQKKVSD